MMSQLTISMQIGLLLREGWIATVILKLQFLKMMCQVQEETASLNSFYFFLVVYTSLGEKKKKHTKTKTIKSD